MTTRLSVNLNDECALVVRRKQDTGQTATETIRRAISLYAYAEAMRSINGAVLVRHPDGTVNELVLL